jgi:hypothetical protein
MSRIAIWSFAALFGLSSAVVPAASQDGRTFVIADDGGYGITGCFSPGVACGRSVADTWCASQGRGAATAFGLASDITASVGDARPGKLDPNSIVITCGD